MKKDEAHQKVRDKASSKFKYVVQVALSFLRRPFQRLISNNFKELPDNMNETYTRYLRQLAPNYLRLLQTALTWTLLADADVTAHEVIDAYIGTYLVYNEIDEQECKNFANVDDIKVYVDQIRDTGGLFPERRRQRHNPHCGAQGSAWCQECLLRVYISRIF